MDFPRPLVAARFVRREKRFTIHAETDDGSPLLAHTNNTGRMSGCLAPGAPIWLSPAANPARKLPFTLELVATVPGGTLVGVNTNLANRLMAEAWHGGLLPGLDAYGRISAEVPYGSQGSRADFLLEEHQRDPGRRCWVEVKNVTLVTDGCARFPDAPTARGRKHLEELREQVQQGDEAALVFCIQREDAGSVGPAWDIDPAYGKLLQEAVAAGLQVLGARCRVTPENISIQEMVPVKLAGFEV